MTENKIDFKTITLGEWLTYWFDTYKKPYLADTSNRNIEQMMRLHTPDWLKVKQLNTITVFDIDNALAVFPACRTRTYVRQTWHSAFEKAEKLGLIQRNVVTLSESVKYKKERGKALTIAEQNKFLNDIKGKRVEYLMQFYLHTGLRRAEATDLKWTDIDENANVIHVQGTKTECSNRDIPLTNDIKQILEAQRRQTENEKGTRFESKKPEYIFDYSPNYLSQLFKKLCPNHHLHDLRHTYVTRCAESGINISACQAFVGHSSPQMTLGIYTHVLDNFKRNEAEKFSLNPLST